MALCTLTGTLRDAGGNPLANTAVSFYGADQQVVDGGLITLTQVIATTDVAGELVVDLLQGASVRVRCPPAGLRRPA